MQSKFLFILVLVPSLCSAAHANPNRSLQVSPPALAVSAFTEKSTSRNEGTPSPRPPLTNINTNAQHARPLTPVPLGNLEEEEEEEEDKKPRTKYTPPAAFQQKTLSNRPLPLSVQGRPTQTTIEETNEENEA